MNHVRHVKQKDDDDGVQCHLQGGCSTGPESWVRIGSGSASRFKPTYPCKANDNNIVKLPFRFEVRTGKNSSPRADVQHMLPLFAAPAQSS